MPLIALDNFLGAALVGVMVSCVIYGITCLQVYLYYTESARRDGPLLKAFVAFLMVLDTSHMALLCHSVYYYMVSSFGDYGALGHAVWSLSAHSMLGSLLACNVQLFFAYRVYRLSGNRNRWLPALIIFLALGQSTCVVGFTVASFQVPIFAEANKSLKWGWAALSTVMACDVVITAGMIYYLNRSRTDFGRTNRAINMLVTYSLNTGLLTTIFALVTLVLSITHANNLIYGAFYFVLIRLYSCSFMSTLNLRNVVRAALNGNRRDIVTMSYGRARAQTDREHPSDTISIEGDSIHFKTVSTELAGQREQHGDKV